MHFSSLRSLSTRMTSMIRSRSSSPTLASGSASPANDPPAKRAKVSTASEQQQQKEPSTTSNHTNGCEKKTYSFVPAYGQGLHLAPMVRCGTMPTRLLSLSHGANLVWGPEIVDRAILDCERAVNPTTGVVSFVKDGKSVWDTHPVEKKRLIFQIGSATPELAARAAKMVQDDVAGVDLNCGCPKSFSTSGAMGAMLLTAPDTLCAILRALVEALHVPVSCKIRLLPTQEATLALVRRIAQTNITNLTVHCRTKDMRPREPALIDRLRDIVEVMSSTGIPVVANGDCLGYLDADRVRQLTGVSACMIARAAEANPSCFDANGLRDPVTDIVPRYIRIAHATDNHFSNSKYCLNAMDFAASPLKGQAGMPKRRKAAKTALGQSKEYDVLAKTFSTQLLSSDEKANWVDLLVPELKSLPDLPPPITTNGDDASQHQPPA